MHSLKCNVLTSLLVIMDYFWATAFGKIVGGKRSPVTANELLVPLELPRLLAFQVFKKISVEQRLLGQFVLVHSSQQPRPKQLCKKKMQIKSKQKNDLVSFLPHKPQHCITIYLLREHRLTKMICYLFIVEWFKRGRLAILATSSRLIILATRAVRAIAGSKCTNHNRSP